MTETMDVIQYQKNIKRARKIRKKTGTKLMGKWVKIKHVPFVRKVAATEESMDAIERAHEMNTKYPAKRRKIKRVKRGPEKE